ncbi:MAG: formate dehydrogenase [Betaproteobacteria bacterium]|nr:formate dehydrogenase [Betaproteobacteria bacterium]
MQPTSKPKSPKHQATGRRSILRGLGAVTVAAGGATLAYGATVKAAEAARLVPAKGQDAGSTLPSAAGYRLTGNIRSYYRTARY